MKQLSILLTSGFIILTLGLACSQKVVSMEAATRSSTVSTSKPTTLFLVRHAEKQIGKNPNLTISGKRRATELARFLEEVPIDAIYSSDYKRTKETALPTSIHKNLPITAYDPRKLQELADTIISTQAGKTILLIGHSNTNPELINIFTQTKNYPAMNEKQYDDIFLLRIHEIGTTEVLHFQYGKLTE